MGSNERRWTFIDGPHQDEVFETRFSGVDIPCHDRCTAPPWPPKPRGQWLTHQYRVTSDDDDQRGVMRHTGDVFWTR